MYYEFPLLTVCTAIELRKKVKAFIYVVGLANNEYHMHMYMCIHSCTKVLAVRARLHVYSDAHGPTIYIYYQLCYAYYKCT